MWQNMKNKHNAIGILGGMGPSASVYMHSLLLELSAREFGAFEADEFPEIIHDSIPISDFISDAKRKRLAFLMLSKRVKILGSLGLISAFGIACNTAHVFLPLLKQETDVPFVSMIDEVAKAIGKDIKTVGLMATPVTIRANMYQAALTKRDKKVIIPDSLELQVVEQIIRNVIGGKILKSDAKKLASIAHSLDEKGAQCIILGCTELPLVFPNDFHLPVFNSVEILARALLKKTMKGGE